MIYVKFEDGVNDIYTENLYQWDTYQTLRITGINFGNVTPYVHFANKKSTEALVIQSVKNTDGSVDVSIPNSLLKEKYDILAYIYTNTGLTQKTIRTITIPITARLKPTEYYQPTDEDIATIEKLEFEAKAILDGLYGSNFSETATYKRPNIVYYNHNAYMCNSSNEITGILPTNTSYWQKIVDGAVVTSLSKDSNGNIVFNFSNGSNFTVDMAVKEVNLVDSDDYPGLSLTNDEVNKIKNTNVFDLTNEQVNKCKKFVALKPVEKGSVWGEYSPSKIGLFSIIVKDTEDNKLYPVLMSIEKIVNQVYYSHCMISMSNNLRWYVKYLKVNPDTERWGFGLVGVDDTSASQLQIVSVNQLMEY